jgi:hypothetical protein
VEKFPTSSGAPKASGVGGGVTGRSGRSVSLAASVSSLKMCRAPPLLVKETTG